MENSKRHRNKIKELITILEETYYDEPELKAEIFEEKAKELYEARANKTHKVVDPRNHSHQMASQRPMVKGRRSKK